MDTRLCPICGIGELEKVDYEEKVNDLFAGEVIIKRTYYKCPECGEMADFFNENEKDLKLVDKEVRQKSVDNIVKKLLDQGYKLASIERSLELPQRSLSKWRKGHPDPSAAVVSLLKYVSTFPWLLEVADKNYVSEDAKLIHWRNAFSEIWDICGGESQKLYETHIFAGDGFSSITLILGTKNEVPSHQVVNQEIPTQQMIAGEATTAGVCL